MSTSKSVPDSPVARILTTGHFVTQGRMAAIVVAIVAVAGSGFLLSQPADSARNGNEEQQTALPVAIIVAEPVNSFQQTRHYTGALVARRSAELSFERAARVLTVWVDEGDTVEAGQKLASLDVRRLETRQQILQAQRDAAAAQLAEFVAGPRTETIAAAFAQDEELKAQQKLSRLTYYRTEKLQARNSTSDQSVDNSRLSMESANARLEQARQRLDELKAGTRAEQITGQRAVVDQLDAQLEDVQLDREDSILRAPFDGRIAMRYIDEGTVTAPGEPVVRIIESTAIEARIGLPASSFKNLTYGDSVKLQFGNQHCQATFARVLPEVDLQTRTQLAVFELEDADSAHVAPGQTVRLSLNDRVEATGFWLPTAALSPGQRGLWSAYVVVDQNGSEKIESRPVEVLHTEGERVLVTGTIHVGDRVVAGGIQRIVPGQLVRVSD